jgi:hypothetical protein
MKKSENHCTLMDSGVGSLVSKHPVDTGKLGSGPEIREKLGIR